MFKQNTTHHASSANLLSENNYEVKWKQFFFTVIQQDKDDWNDHLLKAGHNYSCSYAYGWGQTSCTVVI